MLEQARPTGTFVILPTEYRFKRADQLIDVYTRDIITKKKKNGLAFQINPTVLGVELSDRRVVRVPGNAVQLQIYKDNDRRNDILLQVAHIAGRSTRGTLTRSFVRRIFSTEERSLLVGNLLEGEAMQLKSPLEYILIANGLEGLKKAKEMIEGKEYKISEE